MSNACETVSNFWVTTLMYVGLLWQIYFKTGRRTKTFERYRTVAKVQLFKVFFLSLKVEESFCVQFVGLGQDTSQWVIVGDEILLINTQESLYVGGFEVQQMSHPVDWKWKILWTDPVRTPLKKVETRDRIENTTWVQIFRKPVTDRVSYTGLLWSTIILSPLYPWLPPVTVV